MNVWSSAIAERPWSSVASFDLDGTVKTNQFVIDHRFDADPQLKILRGGSPIWLKLIMTLIVVAGGFSGGFLGRCWPIAAIVCGFDLVDATIGKAEYEKMFPENRAKLSGIQKVIALTVFFFLFGLPAALASGFGSLAGWWFGRADGRPWMGFSAAFGAAFIANTILVMTLGCLAGVVASFFVCFAASFKVASSTT